MTDAMIVKQLNIMKDNLLKTQSSNLYFYVAEKTYLRMKKIAKNYKRDKKKNLINRLRRNNFVIRCIKAT